MRRSGSRSIRATRAEMLWSRLRFSASLRRCSADFLSRAVAITRKPRTAHELSRGRRGSLETAQLWAGTVRLAPQCWQTQTFRLGVSRASVIEVEQTGQISVSSEGLWVTGSPIGSPRDEKVTLSSKNRAPRRLSFRFEWVAGPKAQPNPPPSCAISTLLRSSAGATSGQP